MTTTAYVPPSLSASSATVVLTAGSHVLRLDSFSRAAAMLANGECLKSPEFQAGGHTWRIRCYPNGSAKKYHGYVSVVLELASYIVKNVRAEFRFSLVPLRRQGWPAPATYEHAGVVTFGEEGRQFGFMDFISRDWLEKSEKLLDDTLAVRCYVTVLTKQLAPVPVVEEQELERLGLVCACKDDACKRIHAGTVEAAMALRTMQPRRRRRVKEACLRLLGRVRVE